MGAHMARNLLKKGETVRVYDVLDSNAKSVQGAEVCSSPEDAAKDASVIFTMLPNGKIVKDAVTGEKGILKSAPKGSLLIDCSTIEPQMAQEISKIATENKVNFIDAPVSGGVTGAEAATLTFMIGGDQKHLKTAEHLLEKMGGRILHCGDIGAGQIAKICNNLILGVTMIGTAEALNLGIKLGLDPKTLVSVVNVSSGRSWSSDTYNPVPGIMPNVPSSKGYKGGFAVQLIAKDLGLAENAAISCTAPVPLAAAAHQIYRTLMANGHADKDFGAVYQFFKGNLKE